MVPRTKHTIKTGTSIRSAREAAAAATERRGTNLPSTCTCTCTCPYPSPFCFLRPSLLSNMTPLQSPQHFDPEQQQQQRHNVQLKGDTIGQGLPDDGKKYKSMGGKEGTKTCIGGHELARWRHMSPPPTVRPVAFVRDGGEGKNGTEVKSYW